MRRLLRGFCILIAIGFCTLAVFGALAIAARAAGVMGVLIGLFILPITGLAAPIYEVVKHGNWWPVLYIYGGSLAAQVFGGIAIKLGDS